MIAHPRQITGALRRALLVACLAVFAAALPATATAAPAASANAAKPKTAAKKTKRQTPSSVNKTQLRRAQRLLAIGQTGTHDNRTRGVVRRFQKLREIPVHGIVDKTTYREVRAAFALISARSTATASQSPEITAATGGVVLGAEPAAGFALPEGAAAITGTERAILDRIGRCESGGNARIVSSGGQYRGKYQFSTATWKTVGGEGDPADASEDEQDHRAAILLRRQGTNPWPTCGRGLV